MKYMKYTKYTKYNKISTHIWSSDVERDVDSKSKCIKSLYIDTPWAVKARNSNKMFHRLSSDTRHYHHWNASEHKRRMQLKQRSAKKRRLQLRAQRNRKWKVVAANKK